MGGLPAQVFFHFEIERVIKAAAELGLKGERGMVSMQGCFFL